jgi:hypothetical protein
MADAVKATYCNLYRGLALDALIWSGGRLGNGGQRHVRCTNASGLWVSQGPGVERPVMVHPSIISTEDWHRAPSGRRPRPVRRRNARRPLSRRAATFRAGGHLAQSRTVLSSRATSVGQETRGAARRWLPVQSARRSAPAIGVHDLLACLSRMRIREPSIWRARATISIFGPTAQMEGSAPLAGVSTRQASCRMSIPKPALEGTPKPVVSSAFMGRVVDTNRLRPSDEPRRRADAHPGCGLQVKVPTLT